MFKKDGRDLKNFPPNASSLFQDVLKVSFITGDVWNHSLVFGHDYQIQKIGYIPNWTKFQEASALARKLVKGGCKPEKGCSG